MTEWQSGNKITSVKNSHLGKKIKGNSSHQFIAIMKSTWVGIIKAPFSDSEELFDFFQSGSTCF